MGDVTLLPQRQMSSPETSKLIMAEILRLWAGTTHSPDQDANQEMIFSVWLDHLKNYPLSTIKKVMRTLMLGGKGWWPSIAEFEKARTWKPEICPFKR